MEIWKKIENYPYYRISDKGRIKVIDREVRVTNNKIAIRKEKVMVSVITKFGYKRVGLTNQGRKKLFYIHVLVAKAFIKNQRNKKQVNHKDGNKINNIVSNLEWVTPKENTEHAFKNNLTKGNNLGEKNYFSKLTEIDILNIRQRKNESKKKISVDYAVNTKTIYNILTKKTWKHII